MLRIHAVRADRVWSSRGEPTIEIEVTVEGGAKGRATAPAALSPGRGEAFERRDGGAAFLGRGVSKAVASANAELPSALRGLDATDGELIDRTLIALDATANKSRLGANTLFAASLATALAAANASGLPLWRHLAGATVPLHVPLPWVSLFAGGRHAPGSIDLQDVGLLAIGADDIVTALDWSAEVTRAARDALMANGSFAGAGSTGALWPAFDSNEQAIDAAVRAIERAGFTPGEDIAIGVDVAASTLGRGGAYAFVREGRPLSAGALIGELIRWLSQYPIVAIEDPLSEDDLANFAHFTRASGASVLVIADEAIASDARRVEQLLNDQVSNAVAIIPAAVGTLIEARSAVTAARARGAGVVMSARGIEGEPQVLPHVATAFGCDMMRCGGLSGERSGLWNEALRIARELPTRGKLPARERFPW